MTPWQDLRTPGPGYPRGWVFLLLFTLAELDPADQRSELSPRLWPHLQRVRERYGQPLRLDLHLPAEVDAKLWRMFHRRFVGACTMRMSPSPWVRQLAAQFEAERAMAAIDSVMGGGGD